MSEYVLAQDILDGHPDDPRIEAAIRLRRRWHQTECTPCECVHEVTISTIRTVTGYTDADGLPAGTVTTERPMVLHRFARKEKSE